MRPVLFVGGALLLLAGALLACSGAHEPTQEGNDAARTPRGVGRPASNAPVLNVPSLLGLRLDELSQRLGEPQPTPAEFLDPAKASWRDTGSPPDSAVLFQRKGLEIIASYDLRSGQVSDLLLLGGSEEELMRRGGLSATAPGYLVLPVFKGNNSPRLIGLRVVPEAKPRR